MEEKQSDSRRLTGSHGGWKEVGVEMKDVSTQDSTSKQKPFKKEDKLKHS